MRGGASVRLIAIGAAMLVGDRAGAEELCGRSFVAFDKFYAAVAEEKTHQIRGGGPDDAMFIDSKGTIWFFAKQSHPAFPAVACARRMQKDQQVELQGHFWCRALEGSACDLFLQGFPTADSMASAFEWK